MRLEIVIPDSTIPSVKNKLSRLTKRLSENPELVENMMNDEPEAIPDYLSIMDQAATSPNRFKSGQEVDDYLQELRAEW